jgi:DNA-directed RNA polymerase subunit RPC12/RpoP
MQQFDSFVASELYCPKCGVSQPVREKLLLVLPTGELYEYLCSRCATSLGKRTVTGGRPIVRGRTQLRSGSTPAKRRLLR